jgi:hypothetical protein
MVTCYIEVINRLMHRMQEEHLCRGAQNQPFEEGEQDEKVI